MLNYQFPRVAASCWRTQIFRGWILSLGLVTVGVTGCGSTTTSSPEEASPEESSRANPGASHPGSASGPAASHQLVDEQNSSSSDSLPSPAMANPPAASSSSGELASSSASATDSVQRPDSAEPIEQLPSPTALIPRLELKSGWSPSQLEDFLGDADAEMGGLINSRSGAMDPQALRTEVERIVTLKRVAAERLSEHPDATEREQANGHRGVLQSLSHLASMGDVKAATELQAVAEESRHSSNPALRADSQLVLIGLAIESLRHGKADAAQRILSLLDELLDTDEQVDVATLMVLGQAKDALLQYEYQDEAEQVRDLILERFSGAQDAEVARMAALIAASGFSQADTALERLDQLRQQWVTAAPEASDPEGDQDAAERVTAAAWRAAVDEVLTTPADVLTVEFLCGASLEAEAVGREDIAAATYEVLQKDFSQRQDALGQVARTALRARENREAVIGQDFDPDLPSVDGRPLKMEDYRGKVVLMPFWSSAFPTSLAVLPNLQEIQAANPDSVAVVGMNLDVAGTDVAGFLQRENLSLPSFRSESDPGADIVNEVAYRFGAVTLLFVAVIDAEGQVVHLDFSGEDLTSEVQKRIR
ncbi:TlpA disulfide reductase family protein [Allorhodopirellula solitaria]|uniref:Thioredoxin domain-containing protein n=1 Tax=Allorhodopirellula solitaria TaxID=2527987 RepID=A0A5C5X1L0_9BACT|nr:TlpA disulfide reductase family protein [Allorhodopirellula solitaria]TWT56033.1 hypothetical protein CA85_46250 [Allorhodopirellula solitaria]